jgi:hypothetical protein
MSHADSKAWELLPKWPATFRALESVTTAKHCVIVFAFSAYHESFAIVPLLNDGFDGAPIVIEPSYDADVSQKLRRFAQAEYIEERITREDVKYRLYLTPARFSVCDVARTSADMEIAFAAAQKEERYAILRYRSGLALDPIYFEKPYDSSNVFRALMRFADGDYPKVDELLKSYNARFGGRGSLMTAASIIGVAIALDGEETK